MPNISNPNIALGKVNEFGTSFDKIIAATSNEVFQSSSITSSLAKHSIFRIGDRVRLLRGHTKMVVVRVEFYLLDNVVKDVVIYAEYAKKYDLRKRHPTQIKNNDGPFNDFCESRKVRQQDGFVGWCEWDEAIDEYKISKDNVNKTQTEKESKMALYQTKEKKPRYGMYLATNSQGQFVLEMKGKGGVPEAFKAGDIEKVIPYTFRTAINQHYSCKEGDVAFGDILALDDGELISVTMLNTGQEDAPPFKGRKLVSEPFNTGE